MERIEQNEQWKLQGNCQVCRRRNYCSKLCTAKQRANQIAFNAAMYNAMDKTTGGAITATLSAINKN